MELINKNSDVSREIKIVKDKNNDLILTVYSVGGNSLRILINKDYSESIEEAKSLRISGYINQSLPEDLATKVYVSSLVSLRVILMEARLIVDEPILIGVDISPIPLEDLPDEVLEELEENEDLSVSMGLNYNIDIDEESNVSEVLPRLMREVTSLVLLLNHRLLDYTSLN